MGTLLLLLVAASLSVQAQEYSSSNFTVSDPVVFPGGYATSSTFGLSGVISQMAIGSSTGAFAQLFGGFLYFPFVSTPALSATAGNGQVSLTWTSADATLGWAVSGYSIGKSTISGGPYTYGSVGNVLASTQTGLANSTPYYFVVRVMDAVGDFIATSTEVTATPVAGNTGNNSGGGGGGGGGGGNSGGSNNGGSSVTFAGRAYPGSRVTLLKDAQIAITTVAGPDARFEVTLSGLSAGAYSFSLYSVDNASRRSDPVTLPITLMTNVSTRVGGLYIAPTIAVDKAEVKKGDDIAIFGQTVNKSEVTIQVNSGEPLFAKTNADADGVYLYNFDTTPLELGNHSTKSKSATSTEISPYGATVGFIVGNVNKLVEVSKVCRRADFNCDGKVNLVDFSILLYWYNKTKPPANIDLNSDSKISLIDFSIFAYEWTG